MEQGRSRDGISVPLCCECVVAGKAERVRAVACQRPFSDHSPIRTGPRGIYTLLFEDRNVEIYGLVFGAVSAAGVVTGFAIKGVNLLRSLEGQLSQLRLSQAEGDHRCQSDLSEIRTQLALIQGQLELARSIAAHPRHKRGEPIE